MSDFGDDPKFYTVRGRSRRRSGGQIEAESPPSSRPQPVDPELEGCPIVPMGHRAGAD
jgi:hypothetical protein